MNAKVLVASASKCFFERGRLNEIARDVVDEIYDSSYAKNSIFKIAERRCQFQIYSQRRFQVTL